MRSPDPSPPRRDSLGVIFSSATYPLAEFQRLSGLGEAALRSARRQGLLVHKVGSRKFVRGHDWHEFLAKRASDPRTKP
jgi:hypothetical protein